MNPYVSPIPDVQSKPDMRKIAIQHVGVKGVRYPIRFKSGSAIHASVGTWNLYVQLPSDKKGTHMSRFIALLEGINEADAPPLDICGFTDLLAKMLTLLEAQEGRIDLAFPFFIKKTAPVSGVQSLMDYLVEIRGEMKNGIVQIWQKIVVPVTSLCPCSREISDYGAHNQRSHITANVLLNDEMSIEELVSKIESQGSCELYGLLKRPDEKFVTEKAYENPKFVEDLVRDVAGVLNADKRIDAYTLEAENFESIHNHSAYAYIEHDKRTAT